MKLVVSMNYDLKRIQEIELEIFDEIIRICKKYNLKYALIGGSTLGAVRHHGFIPWDDDIDLGMPRKDYEKFCELCKTELDAKRFMLQNFDTEPNCGLIFGKVRRLNTTLSEYYSYHIDMNQGVWVDIFPYDYVSNNATTRKSDIRSLKFYQNLYIIKCGYKFPNNRSNTLKIAYDIAKGGLRLWSKNRLIKKVKQIMIKYDKDTTDYIFPYGGVYTDKDLLPGDTFDNLIQVSFEGRKVNIYKEFDKYLTTLYGDYMKLPPVEKRGNGSGHIVHEFRDDRLKEQ